MQNYMKRILTTSALALGLLGSSDANAAKNKCFTYGVQKQVVMNDSTKKNLVSWIEQDCKTQDHAKVKSLVDHLGTESLLNVKNIEVSTDGDSLCYDTGKTAAMQTGTNVAGSFCTGVPIPARTSSPDYVAQLVAFDKALESNDCPVAQKLYNEVPKSIESVLKNPSAFDTIYSSTTLKGVAKEFKDKESVLKGCVKLVALKEKKGLKNVTGKAPEKAKVPSDYSWGVGAGLGFFSHEGMDMNATQGVLSASYKNNTVDFFFGTTALGSDGEKTVPYAHSVAGPITFDTQGRYKESSKNFGLMYWRDGLFNTGLSAGLGFNVSMLEKELYLKESASMGGATTTKAEYKAKSGSTSSTSLSPILGAGYAGKNGYSIKVAGFLGDYGGASVTLGKKFGLSK